MADQLLMGKPSFIFERGSIIIYSPSRKNSATVKLHGAHVSSFKVGEHELFYMSSHMNASLFDEFNKNPSNRTAIRGGKDIKRERESDVLFSSLV